MVWGYFLSLGWIGSRKRKNQRDISPPVIKDHNPIMVLLKNPWL